MTLSRPKLRFFHDLFGLCQERARHHRPQATTMEDPVGFCFAGLQILTFVGSMVWFVSLRKRYKSVVGAWLVPHTGIVGYGVAISTITCILHYVNPYWPLTLRFAIPSDGYIYCSTIFPCVHFSFLYSLTQRKGDWLWRLLVLLALWTCCIVVYTCSLLPFGSSVSSGTFFLSINTIGLFTVKTHPRLWQSFGSKLK